MGIVLFGSFVPALLLTYWIYTIDLHKEPFAHVLGAFLIGVLSPLLTLQIAHYTMFFPELVEYHPFLKAFLAAGLPEEVGRFLLLGLICTHWKSINEPFDCIVYAAAIWTGFSAIETVMYASETINNDYVAILVMSVRAALCTLGHLSYGIIAGTYLGIALFAKLGFWPFIFRGLAISISLHTLYDGILFSAVEFGGPWKLIAAIIADAFTMILAMLFILKLRVIQAISSFEGELSSEQGQLLSRHLPDQDYGLFKIIDHFGYKGFGQILLSLVMGSLCISCLLYSLSKPTFISISCLFISFILGLKILQKVFCKIKELHEQSSEQLLDEIDKI